MPLEILMAETVKEIISKTVKQAEGVSLPFRPMQCTAKINGRLRKKEILKSSGPEGGESQNGRDTCKPTFIGIYLGEDTAK